MHCIKAASWPHSSPTSALRSIRIVPWPWTRL